MGEKKKEKTCFALADMEGYEACPVLHSIPFRCTCWTLTIILWWLIHYPSVHPDSKSERILLLHAQGHRNILVCVWHISRPCVVENLVAGSPECVMFPFLYCVCEGICSWKKKKISNVFRRLFIPTLSSPLAPGGDGSAPNVHPRASFQQRPLWWQVHSHKHYPV